MQPREKWDCGTTGIGVLVSDSLMFQRGEPSPSDPWLDNVYGLAMPLVKHGLPVTPVQLENVAAPHYLDGFRILYLSYDGQKPSSPEVHAPLAHWVKNGGVWVFCDQDADPYLKVRDWWNGGGDNFSPPRQHLFQQLGITDSTATNQFNPVGRGGLIWTHERPAQFSTSVGGAAQIIEAARLAAKHADLKWSGKNYLLLRRSPYHRVRPG
jgi:hypothetical protein